MNIFIAEKPSLGRVIADALGGGQMKDNFIEGQGWRVCWCIGHLFEAYRPRDYNENWRGFKKENLPMIPDEWKTKPKREARKFLTAIGSSLKLATRVINAGDPDREGQLLVDEAIAHFNWKGEVLRLWLPDLTDKTVKKALQNMRPNSEYLGLQQSALARQMADWLIGMNLTAAKTLVNEERKLTSVGRVQTPTLSLIVERDREINNFVPRPFYEIWGEFKKNEISYTGQLVVDPSLLSDDGYLLDKNLAEQLKSNINSTDGVLTKIEINKTTKQPPIGYSLSGLQFDASKLFGFSAKKTLDIAQKLYTSKITTYPRTDCSYLAENQLGEAPGILKNLLETNEFVSIVAATNIDLDFEQKSNIWNDKKTTAHTAIIPTESMSSSIFNKLSEQEKLLFRLIAVRYLVQFAPPQIIEKMNFITNVEGNEFKTSGSKILQNGWQSFYDVGKESKPKEIFPLLDGQNKPLEGDKASLGGLVLVNKETSCPKHFTEGTLIRAMSNISKYIEDPEAKKLLRETDGIGTEATRSSILERLKNQKYVTVTKQAIKATSEGFKLIDGFDSNIKSPILTARWEGMLKDIETGDANMQDFLNDQVDFIQSELDCIDFSNVIDTPIRTDVLTDHKCVDCGNQLKKVERKNKKGYFYPCSKKGCGFSAIDAKEGGLIYKPAGEKTWNVLPALINKGA